MKAFISYSACDGFAASMIEHWLKLIRVDTVRFEEDFIIGKPFTLQIVNAMQGCDIVLAILSPSFIESAWCAEEMKFAAQVSKQVIFFQLTKHIAPPDPHSSILPHDISMGRLAARRDIFYKALLPRLSGPVQAMPNTKDLDGWFSELVRPNEHVRKAARRENLLGNRLCVSSTVELACNLEGWVQHPGSDGSNGISISFESSFGLTEGERRLMEQTKGPPVGDRINCALCRLEEPLSDQPWLSLTFAPIPHSTVRHVADHFETLRQSEDLHLFDPSRLHYCNSTVVHLVIVTCDGYLLLGHRSSRPRFYENTWSVSCEEHLDFQKDGGNPFAAALRGIKEELVGDAFSPSGVGIKLFSVSRELDRWEHSVQRVTFWDVNIAIAGKVTLPITLDEVFSRWRSTAEDRREFRHLLGLPYSYPTLRKLLVTTRLEPQNFRDDGLRIPPGTDPEFRDFAHHDLWTRQHPSNNIRIIRCMTHDFLEACYDEVALVGPCD